jgi:hypothetical protein
VEQYFQSLYRRDVSVYTLTDDWNIGSNTTWLMGREEPGKLIWQEIKRGRVCA